MLLHEMVRGRKNSDVIVDNTSQVYFLYWIYNRLDQGEELHIRIDEEDTQIVKKLTMSDFGVFDGSQQIVLL